MSVVFDLDKTSRKNREIIKVVGVGGGGNNALNHIIRNGIDGVEFIAANTDSSHLEHSEAAFRIALGKQRTRGLGAGSDPVVGKEAAEESRDEIRAALEGADMVFIAAGMGGGTGTGASPVIANIAKETGALVVAVVTRPFSFEGKRRYAYASDGIASLREQVDALIVIPNDRLVDISTKHTSFTDAFKLADSVLNQAVLGVTDLILHPGVVNVDFADVRTVMSNAGAAIMGIGEGFGENRVAQATHGAINSPLMETPMVGAKKVLFNVSVGPNVGIHEIQEAGEIIKNASDDDALAIWGYMYDPEMEDGVKITVIAADFKEVPGNSNDIYRPRGGTAPTRPPVQPTSPQPPVRPAAGPQPRPQNPVPRPQPAPARSGGDTDASAKSADQSAGAGNYFGSGPMDQWDVPAYLRKKK